jgi:hypothetical protein
MQRALILAATIVCLACPAGAQLGSAYPQSGSDRGPAFPKPGADQGPAYPKGVSPTDSNPANWIAPAPEYTDPNGPNSKRYGRYYYNGRYRRYR